MKLMINGVALNDPQRPYIIAEAAGTHGQDYSTAAGLVHAAAQAGADAIKFQTFIAEDICADIPLPFGHDPASDAWLQRLGVTRMRELFARGGLPRPWHKPLKALAQALGLAFLSTPFSVDAARFLVEDIGVPALKMASGDITFRPLLEYARTTGLPILVSTGASTLDEVLNTRTLLQGENPTQAIVFLHCVCAYPCPPEAANLAAIQHLRAFTGLEETVGWSDHTTSPDIVPALAVAMGATVIEKHLRLAGDTSSIDAGHSIDPDAFAALTTLVRQVPGLLGTGEKIPHGIEGHERLWIRRDPSDWKRPMQSARAGKWA